MKVLFASSEAAPFFKSGGLGDVAGALPKELAKKEIDIRVVLPFHTTMPQQYKDQLEEVMQFSVKVGWRDQFCGIKKLEMDGVIYYFIDNLYYFDRPSLYGFDDDGQRFAFFSQAVIEMMEKVEFIPDVIHCNDWHTALIPVLLKDKYHWIHAYSDIKTVLTIHNLQFQGIYDQGVLSDWLGIGYNAYHERGLKYYDNVNFMKGGIYYTDLVTTVSPTYAGEIQTEAFGYGLEGVLRDNNWKLAGILNGIDYDVFDPASDPAISTHYSTETLNQKKQNKLALQQHIGLPEDQDVLLIGMVSRLTEQKGLALVQHIMAQLMEREIQVVILGTGEAEFENSFHYFNHRYPDQFKAVIDFDVKLAQQIYAGSDLFLMPSAFEPCGLSQMISMRYGTLPLVHETGGLVDTVAPYDETTGKGTGFSFHDFVPEVLLSLIDYASSIYYNRPDEWRNLQEQAMSQDFSWDASAQQYIEHYTRLGL